MDILYLIVSHLIGRVSYGSLGNLNFANLGSGLLPVAFFGTITWLLAQYRDDISTWLIDRFTVTATFDSSNQAYGWMQTWAASQPGWSSLRQVQVASNNGNGDFFSWYHRHMKLETSNPYWCRPTSGTSMFCRFEGVLVHITFYDPTNTGGYYIPATMVMRLWGFDRARLDRLLTEARAMYKKSREGLQVWTHSQALEGKADWENWCVMGRRSIDTLVLDEEIKARSLEDVREFLSEDSKQWYKDNSLPYRRGYLFYGVPGSGKTTLIHCIANELDREVCVVTLSAVDDVTLPKLLGSTPEKSVVIMEDIDVAIQDFKTAPNESRSSTAMQRDGRKTERSQTGLTLSGLLNAIDGVTSQNGRVLFVTTNKEATLDPALTRAGRLDVHIEFFHAKSEHAAQLFRRFYSMPSAKSREAGVSHSPEDMDVLAKRFAEAVPDGVLSMAQLQNYLMSHKHEPGKASDGVRGWVAREQLKTEKRRAQAAATDVQVDVKPNPPSPSANDDGAPELDATSTDTSSDSTLASSPRNHYDALLENVKEQSQAVDTLPTGVLAAATASEETLAGDVGREEHAVDKLPGDSAVKTDTAVAG